MFSIHERKLRWQEKKALFAKITDRTGMPIDSGILETIIALNTLGITTSQSCEGHLDHGRPYPWITFITPNAVKIARLSASAFTQALQQKEQDNCSEEVLHALYDKANQLKSQAEQVHAADQQKLLNHLTAFYSVRHTSFDCRLMLYTRVPGTSCLESQGATTIIGHPPEIQKQKLQTYQQEMLAFTEFLQKMYFLHNTSDYLTSGL
jgi:hypothetical protein